MMRSVFKPRKFASAIAYMVQQRTGLTMEQICCLLFFADKRHLLSYGRTITGVRYYALEHGPAPSHCIGNAEPKSPLDLKPLSKSDLKVLNEIVSTYADLPARKLEQLTQEEPAWTQTPQDEQIDFDLFFAGHPEAGLVKSILQEEYGWRDTLNVNHE